MVLKCFSCKLKSHGRYGIDSSSVKKGFYKPLDQRHCERSEAISESKPEPINALIVVNAGQEFSL